MNRRLLLVGIVALVLGVIGALQLASYIVSREYQAPSRAEAEDPTPRMQGLIDETEEAQKRALELPYVG